MKLAALAALSILSLSACAAETGNEADTEVTDAAESALSTSSNYGYFIVTRHDMRKCISPVCGGFYVKRVNQATTRCADGSLQKECYVSEITYAGVGLSEEEEASLRAAVESGKGLVKARLYKQTFNGNVLGKLKASEGWLGATGSVADGTFYRGADNGIRCVKAPCPSTTAYGLNGAANHNVIDVKLGGTATPADPDLLSQAQSALGTKEGILFAGGIALPKCIPGAACGPFATVTEFYLRATHTEGKSCGGRGMGACGAGQFCSYTAAAACGSFDAPGTCGYAPTACNKMAAPVCGCDGVTYGNECLAHAAGTSAMSAGPCAPQP
jgi:hypothetical protein